MTILEAFKEFTESPEFKELSKGMDSETVKYRVYLSRFRSGKLKTGAMVEILETNGYEIKANKVSKKTKL